MARKPKFIQKAINPKHKGDFKAKAEAAGETTRAYAQKEEHAPGLLGQQARLAETLMSLPHSKRRGPDPRNMYK
jgi:hypothetical protein